MKPLDFNIGSLIARRVTVRKASRGLALFTQDGARADRPAAGRRATFPGVKPILRPKLQDGRSHRSSCRHTQLLTSQREGAGIRLRNDSSPLVLCPCQRHVIASSDVPNTKCISHPGIKLAHIPVNSPLPKKTLCGAKSKVANPARCPCCLPPTWPPNMPALGSRAAWSSCRLRVGSPSSRVPSPKYEPRHSIFSQK